MTDLTAKQACEWLSFLEGGCDEVCRLKVLQPPEEVDNCNVQCQINLSRKRIAALIDQQAREIERLQELLRVSEESRETLLTRIAALQQEKSQ